MEKEREGMKRETELIEKKKEELSKTENKTEISERERER